MIRFDKIKISKYEGEKEFQFLYSYGLLLQPLISHENPCVTCTARKSDWFKLFFGQPDWLRLHTTSN